MYIKTSAWCSHSNHIARYLFVFFAFCLPISIAVENISFFLTLLPALLSGSWWYSRRLLIESAFSWWLLLLFLLFLAGLFYTEASYHWRFSVLRKEGYIMAILFLLPVISLDRSFLLRAIKAYVIGCTITLLIAWLGYFHWLPQYLLQLPAPYYIFFKIYAALFMTFGAYLTLILLKLNWHSVTRWFWLLIFILMSYNVLWQSLSRTGYIIYAMLMFVFVWQTLHFRARIIGTIILAMATLVVFLLSSNFHTGLGRAVHNFNRTGTSAGIRHEHMITSLRLWQQKPIFGYGTGGFRPADFKIKHIGPNGSVVNIGRMQDSPENTYFRILVEYGMVGLLVLILLWGWQCVAAFRLSEPVARQIAMAFMLVMIVASMSQDLLLDNSPCMFYVLFSTLLYAPLIMRKRGLC